RRGSFRWGFRVPRLATDEVRDRSGNDWTLSQILPNLARSPAGAPAAFSGICGGGPGALMRHSLSRAALIAAMLVGAVAFGLAEDGGQGGWFSGDWYLKAGGSGFTAPKYQGDDTYELMFSPIISLGKAGDDPRFTSRNDNISLGLFDNGGVRAGLVGRFVMPRDASDSSDLAGLHDIPFGVEVGGFAEGYP